MTDDGENCWPGLDIDLPLSLNNDKVGEAKDDIYLYNMGRLEAMFNPKMF